MVLFYRSGKPQAQRVGCIAENSRPLAARAIDPESAIEVVLGRMGKLEGKVPVTAKQLKELHIQTVIPPQ